MSSTRLNARAGSPAWRQRSGFLAAAIALLLALGAPAHAEDMPQLQDLLKPLPAPHPPTIFFDESGQQLGMLVPPHDQRTVLFANIPVALRDALVDTEDPRFYQEGAFDLRGIGRALLVDLLAGKARQGASTLTQQLARTLLNDRRKTLSRKVKEAWLAVQLEQKYSKDSILTLYFNDVYWGHGTFGIGAAADRYFGTRLSHLSLGQMAILAAMVRGPAYYDPYSDAGIFRLATRQKYVLDRMVAAGHITALQAEQASHLRAADALTRNVASHRLALAAAASRLRTVMGISTTPTAYRWFFRRVREEAAAQLTRRDPSGKLLQDGQQVVDDDGLAIVTTMDPAIQRDAEEAAQNGLARDGKRYGFSQVAIVAIEPATGKVRALVGGVGDTEYDRTMARLQTGSAFKPFVYLTAFERGMRPDDVIDDEFARYPSGPGHWYIPHNDDHRFHGKVSLRTALIQSINSVAVKLESQIGIDPIVATARALGIRSPLNHDLTLALGSSDLSPLELCSAYAALANQGVWVQPSIFSKISVPGGSVLDRPVPQQRTAADRDQVNTLVQVMEGVLGPDGTAAGQGIWRPAAGKTGTSSDYRDAWFVGFTPQLCAAVWVGNDDRRPMKGAYGGVVAARIWHDLMVRALKGKPVIPFPAPGSPSVSIPASATGSPIPLPAATGRSAG